MRGFLLPKKTGTNCTDLLDFDRLTPQQQNGVQSEPEETNPRPAKICPTTTSIARLECIRKKLWCGCVPPTALDGGRWRSSELRTGRDIAPFAHEPHHIRKLNVCQKSRQSHWPTVRVPTVIRALPHMPGVSTFSGSSTRINTS